MKIKPIIIVSGEPYSVFLEIFFKTLKNKKIKTSRTPIVVIASYALLLKQMQKLKYSFKINLIDDKLAQFTSQIAQKPSVRKLVFNF